MKKKHVHNTNPLFCFENGIMPSGFFPRSGETTNVIISFLYFPLTERFSYTSSHEDQNPTSQFERISVAKQHSLNVKYVARAEYFIKPVAVLQVWLSGSSG